jgi:hypothetical protein
LISEKRATALVGDKRIKGVSLTEVRRLVASEAGKYLKKSVLNWVVMMLSSFLKMQTLTKL